MSKIFIFGGAGKVSRQLISRLSGAGHQALALHRSESQHEMLASLGATPVSGDLTKLSSDALAGMMPGCDAVVFAAGAGGAGQEVTNAVDGHGLELAVEAARKAGISRFLLVSAFMDADRDKPRSEGFENYMRVKRAADAHLVASGLDYVIVRAGMLNDEPGTGKVSADMAIPYATVPRADIAAALAGILERPSLNHTIIEVTSGDTPIAAALDRLVSA